MTLQQLRASLAKARARAKRYGLLERRNKRLARRRVKQIKARKRGAVAAVRWALEQVGTVEKPPGSNRGPKITDWQSKLGSWLVGQAWCGVFVGTAMMRAGVTNVTSRVAACAFIEDDARAGRNGFAKLVPAHEAQAGDAVLLFGRGVHVELVESAERTQHGVVLRTIGGNTSAGTAGSQSNGGGVFRRVRHQADVHAIARPRYP